ncbi:hypothetical protein [Parvularcula marina]|uniref:Thioredoxin domain-containing protein n=1 Tax=Parvularcula marina TaxID=2292771 RepID=A0A371RIH6_9PROT|nr:hypothetical protein [Parvularcula marina]RFB05241.1 hypothetical protein DX908_08215 [Parvularcula marina]
MTDPHAPRTAPLGRLIKLMALIGAGFILFVVFAASQKPRTGPPGLEELAARMPGVRLTANEDGLAAFLAPGEEAETYDVLGAPEGLPGAIAVYFWPADCTTHCETAAQAFIAGLGSNSVFTPVIARQIPRSAGQRWEAALPMGVIGVNHFGGAHREHLSGSPRHIVIFYRNNREIARASGVDWSKQPAQDLIRALQDTLLPDIVFFFAPALCVATSSWLMIRRVP